MDKSEKNPTPDKQQRNALSGETCSSVIEDLLKRAKQALDANLPFISSPEQSSSTKVPRVDPRLNPNKPVSKGLLPLKTFPSPNRVTHFPSQNTNSSSLSSSNRWSMQSPDNRNYSYVSSQMRPQDPCENPNLPGPSRPFTPFEPLRNKTSSSRNQYSQFHNESNTRRTSWHQERDPRFSGIDNFQRVDHAKSVSGEYRASSWSKSCSGERVPVTPSTSRRQERESRDPRLPRRDNLQRDKFVMRQDRAKSVPDNANSVPRYDYYSPSSSLRSKSCNREIAESEDRRNNAKFKCQDRPNVAASLIAEDLPVAQSEVVENVCGGSRSIQKDSKLVKKTRKELMVVLQRLPERLLKQKLQPEVVHSIQKDRKREKRTKKLMVVLEKLPEHLLKRKMQPEVVDGEVGVDGGGGTCSLQKDSELVVEEPRNDDLRLILQRLPEPDRKLTIQPEVLCKVVDDVGDKEMDVCGGSIQKDIELTTTNKLPERFFKPQVEPKLIDEVVEDVMNNVVDDVMDNVMDNVVDDVMDNVVDDVMDNVMDDVLDNVVDDVMDKVVDLNSPPQENNMNFQDIATGNADEIEEVIEVPTEGIEKMLCVSGIDVIFQNNDYNYICKQPSCIFTTSIQKAFENHCNLAHKQKKSPLACNSCHSKRTVTMAQALHHICEHIDQAAIVISDDDDFPQSSFNIVTVPSSPQPLTLQVVGSRDFTCSPIPMNLDEIPTSRKSALCLNMWMSPAILEKLFKCPSLNCCYASANEIEFTSHLETHEFTSTVPCLYCNFKMTIDYYIKHVVDEHGSCKYGCPSCLYRALYSDYVKRHHIMEHGKANITVLHFNDDTINSVYRSPQVMPMKDLLQPFVCTCLKRYFAKDNFAKHIKCCRMHKGKSIVWNIFPYNCRYCLFGTLATSCFLSHMAKHHPSYKINIITRYLKYPGIVQETEDETIFEKLRVFSRLTDLVEPDVVDISD